MCFKKWFNWGQMAPETPDRIKVFREQIQSLSWTRDNLESSMNVMFNAVDSLAEAEIAYYFSRRRNRARWSVFLRFFAWAFGLAGFVVPFLEATPFLGLGDLGQLGYSALAIAAGCLGANALFGGTHGHIRFVAAQLELEKLVTAQRVLWSQYRVRFDGGVENVNAGFSMILEYANQLHTIIIAESGQWADTTLEALNQFQQRVKESLES